MTLSAYLREQRDVLPKVPCQCGCGALLYAIDTNGKPARFARGHSLSGGATRFKPGQKPIWANDPTQKAKVIERIAAANRDRKVTPDQIVKRTATRLARNGGAYQTERAWKFVPGAFRGRTHSPESRQRMSEAAIQQDRRGEANPFYGRTHSAETRALIAEANRGENNAGWGKPRPPEIRAKISEAKLGDKHPNWRGGITGLPYGPEFKKKFKQLIRERDGHACRRCGKTRAENGPRQGELPVHHMDHDRTNNDPANLVTSCHACNQWAAWHRDEPFLPS